MPLETGFELKANRTHGDTSTKSPKPVHLGHHKTPTVEFFGSNRDLRRAMVTLIALV